MEENKENRIKNEKLSYKIITGIVSILIAILATPGIFEFLGASLGQFILNVLGETIFLLFAFGFPGVFSAVLYIVVCKFLIQEKLADTLGGGIAVGIISIILWAVRVVIEGAKVMIR